MYRLAIAFIGLLAVSAAAAAEDQTYTLTVSQRDLSLINGALIQRPYIEVSELIDRLRSQLQQQLKRKTEDEDKSK